jgi:hypothetical protein
MLAAARTGDSEQLNRLIKETEIPNFQDWFTTTFGLDKGESWAGPYGNMLEENESRFEEHIIRLAQRSGRVSVRKVDSPKMVDTLTRPLEVFLADWNSSESTKNDPVDHIGYFFFIDGKFRWDSAINFMSTTEAISHLISRVDPKAPLLATLAKVGGTVKVHILVDTSGDVVAARAISGTPVLVHPVTIQVVFLALRRR